MSSSEQSESQENVETSAQGAEEASATVSKEDYAALQAALNIKESTIEGLKKKISEYETKISEIRDFVKKMEAETAAIRERSKRDLEKHLQLKVSEFARGFLQLMDNFERSLETVKNENSPFVEGVRLIKREMDEVLKSAGLKRMNTVGENFDPQFHEALGSESVSGDDQDGKITRELRSGYMLGDLVVRPAQVMVGSKA